MSTRKFNIAVIGLGFGAEFIPCGKSIRTRSATPSASAMSRS
jgi:hypothetical protein